MSKLSIGKPQPSVPGTTFSMASQVASNVLELRSGTTIFDRMATTVATTVIRTTPATKPMISAMGTFISLPPGLRSHEPEFTIS